MFSYNALSHFFRAIQIHRYYISSLSSLISHSSSSDSIYYPLFLLDFLLSKISACSRVSIALISLLPLLKFLPFAFLLALFLVLFLDAICLLLQNYRSSYFSFLTDIFLSARISRFPFLLTDLSLNSFNSPLSNSFYFFLLPDFRDFKVFHFRNISSNPFRGRFVCNFLLSKPTLTLFEKLRRLP